MQVISLKMLAWMVAMATCVPWITHSVGGLSPLPLPTQETDVPFLVTKLGHHKYEQSTPQPLETAFYRKNNTYLRAQVGATVVLHCPAKHIGESTVSWIRRRDYHLITVGPNLYTSDQRYQVRYVKKDKDWQLHIRYLQKRDEGIYECQVSSHPPISLMTELRVVEPKSEILGGPEKFLRRGSSLRLVCVLRKTTQPPAYVFWYLDTRMINYDHQVRVETSGDVSVLFLNDLGPESSGNYSCVPSNAQPSTIHIQILNGGEIPAAIHSTAICRAHLDERLIQAFLLVSFSIHFFSFAHFGFHIVSSHSSIASVHFGRSLCSVKS